MDEKKLYDTREAATDTNSNSNGTNTNTNNNDTQDEDTADSLETRQALTPIIATDLPQLNSSIVDDSKKNKLATRKHNPTR